MTNVTGRRWVLDTEGSGQNPNVPIQLAAVEMDGIELTGRSHVWYFRPPTKISYHATRVHGITNRDISQHPTFDDQRAGVIDTLGEDPILGHAVSVELHGMRLHMPDWTPEQAICTLRIAKRLYPDQKRHKLSVLIEQFGLVDKVRAISGQRPHHALYDAVATALLFRNLASAAGEKMPGLMKGYDIVASERARHLREVRRQRREQLKHDARRQEQGRLL